MDDMMEEDIGLFDLDFQLDDGAVQGARLLPLLTQPSAASSSSSSSSSSLALRAEAARASSSWSSSAAASSADPVINEAHDDLVPFDAEDYNSLVRGKAEVAGVELELQLMWNWSPSALMRLMHLMLAKNTPPMQVAVLHRISSNLSINNNKVTTYTRKNSNSRFYASGGNVPYLKSEYRNLLLMGSYSFDIKNCAWTAIRIMHNHLRMVFSISYVDEYLDHTDAVRERLQLCITRRGTSVKTVLLCAAGGWTGWKGVFGAHHEAIQWVSGLLNDVRMVVDAVPHSFLSGLRAYEAQQKTRREHIKIAEDLVAVGHPDFNPVAKKKPGPKAKPKPKKKRARDDSDDEEEKPSGVQALVPRALEQDQDASAEHGRAFFHLYQKLEVQFILTAIKLLQKREPGGVLECQYVYDALYVKRDYNYGIDKWRDEVAALQSQVAKITGWEFKLKAEIVDCPRVFEHGYVRNVCFTGISSNPTEVVINAIVYEFGIARRCKRLGDILFHPSADRFRVYEQHDSDSWGGREDGNWGVAPPSKSAYELIAIDISRRYPEEWRRANYVTIKRWVAEHNDVEFESMTWKQFDVHCIQVANTADGAPCRIYFSNADDKIHIHTWFDGSSWCDGKRSNREWLPCMNDYPKVTAEEVMAAVASDDISIVCPPLGKIMNAQWDAPTIKLILSQIGRCMMPYGKHDSYRIMLLIIGLPQIGKSLTIQTMLKCLVPGMARTMTARSSKFFGKKGPQVMVIDEAESLIGELVDPASLKAWISGTAVDIDAKHEKQNNDCVMTGLEMNFVGVGNSFWPDRKAVDPALLERCLVIPAMKPIGASERDTTLGQQCDDFLPHFHAYCVALYLQTCRAKNFWGEIAVHSAVAMQAKVEASMMYNLVAQFIGNCSASYQVSFDPAQYIQVSMMKKCIDEYAREQGLKDAGLAKSWVRDVQYPGVIVINSIKMCRECRALNPTSAICGGHWKLGKARTTISIIVGLSVQPTSGAPCFNDDGSAKDYISEPFIDHSKQGGLFREQAAADEEVKDDMSFDPRDMNLDYYGELVSACSHFKDALSSTGVTKLTEAKEMLSYIWNQRLRSQSSVVGMSYKPA